jgi:hypothetical protein
MDHHLVLLQHKDSNDPTLLSVQQASPRHDMGLFLALLSTVLMKNPTWVSNLMSPLHHHLM